MLSVPVHSRLRGNRTIDFGRLGSHSSQPLVGRRRLLPDLPALIRRRERRRRGRPGRDRVAAAVPAVARHRRALALADLPVADGRLRLRRQRLLRHRPRVRVARRLRLAARSGPRARHPADDRLGPEPHLQPAPVVPRVARRTRLAEAGLVRLAGPGAPTVASPTTGRPAGRSGRRGPSTRPAASTTSTCSSPSSRT